MKKMKYSKIALTTIISVALLQGSTALAKKKGDLSVYEWGPWAVMARPAAGPQFVAYTPPPSQYTYHPHHPVPPPEPPVPLVPQHAGWATYSWDNSYVESNPHYGRILALYTESIVPHSYTGDLSVDYLEKSFQPTRTVSYHVGPPVLADQNNYPLADSLSMPGVLLDPDQHHPYDPDGTFAYLENNFPLPDVVSATPIYAYKEGEQIEDGSGKTHTQWSRMTGYILKYKPWNLDMVVGAWGNAIKHKIAGIIPNGSTGTDYEYFVYGTTTSQAAIDSLQAGKVTANYTGLTMANRTPVTMTIDFGNNKWSGSWNKGRDGNITISKPDSLGVRHISGNMGFNAGGTLSGPNLITTSITTGSGQIVQNKSVVTNAVFGNQAQMVGGGYQIAKTYQNDSSKVTATQSDITIAINNRLAPQP